MSYPRRRKKFGWITTNLSMNSLKSRVKRSLREGVFLFREEKNEMFEKKEGRYYRLHGLNFRPDVKAE